MFWGEMDIFCPKNIFATNKFSVAVGRNTLYFALSCCHRLENRKLGT